MEIKHLIVKFLWLVILPCSLYCAIAEVLLRRIPNDYSFKSEWLSKNSKDVKILSLGSSHGYFNINPEYFGKPAFNAAHVSQSLNYDFFVFNKFIDQMDSLETVILPISYSSLFSNLEQGEENFRAKKYRIYYHCNYHPYAPKYNFEFDFDMSVIRHRLANFYLGKRNEIMCNSFGYGTSYLLKNKSEDWESEGMVAAKRHTINKKRLMKFFDENVLMLRSIIEKCKERNIHVILLTTPSWHTYYEHLDYQQSAIKENTCEALTAEYENVTYLNLLKDKRFVADDFFDSDHLSEKGAEKLTKILNNN